MKKFFSYIVFLIFISFVFSIQKIFAEKPVENDPTNYLFMADREDLIPISPKDFLSYSTMFLELRGDDAEIVGTTISNNKMKRMGFKLIGDDTFERQDVRVTIDYALDQADEPNLQVILIEFKNKKDADSFFEKVKQLNWEYMEEGMGDEGDIDKNAFWSSGVNNSDLLLGVIIIREDDLHFSLYDY